MRILDRRQTRGFTLTELLVVLSILAVLGALAIPALRGAMDRADRAVCLSNLRQMGQAMSEYVADHRQYPAAELPVRDDAGRVVERRRWYHAIAPYLDSGPRAWSSGQQGHTPSSVVLPSDDDREQQFFPAVFRCPTCSHWEVGRNMGYGYNHQTLGDARIAGTESGHRRYPVRPGEIVDRSRTVLILDSAGTGEGAYRPGSRADTEAIGNHGFTVDPPVLPLRDGSRWGSDGVIAGIGDPVVPSRPSGRHRGGTCVLYCDQRVEWIPLDRLLTTNDLFDGSGGLSGAGYSDP